MELDENSDINSLIVTMYPSGWIHHEISEFTRLIISGRANRNKIILVL